ncbi:MAG: TetR/AcrR family transcriptional regulator [Oscillospiraceae bacterium]|nr:TetR/AcrR family transcriptional regulator [Oscillospiraceae bacterium]
MAVAFTQEQREEIRGKLIEAGFHLSSTIGFKRMSIAKVAGAAGIAAGSFYLFFDSKESFAKALIAEMETRSMAKLKDLIANTGAVSVEEFLNWYRDYFRPENNFLLTLNLGDWVWLKTHITDGSYFEQSRDMEKIRELLPVITGIRKDFDLGVVVNFIKSIYASYQNRETFFEDSLQENVDLIFETIYRYVREDV